MKTDLNVIEVPYKVKYTNKGAIPIGQLVESLLAYEKLLKRVSPFIEEACKGATVVDIEVLVCKVEAGSLLEDFLIRIVFKDKANYDQAIEVAGKMFESNPVLTGAVVIGVAAFIGFGVRNALINQGVTTPSTSIVAYSGAIVQTGGEMNISEKAITDILNKTKDKKKLSQEAIAVISPAQLEEGAAIEFNDNQLKDLTITPAFAKEAPSKYEPPEKTQDTEVLLNTEIEIWASDKDSSTRSWAGIVPGRINKRIKFELNEAINPNDLHGTRSVHADIVITTELDPNKKEFLPRKVEILKIYIFSTLFIYFSHSHVNKKSLFRDLEN
ncbi:MAG: hypothetical protein KJ990_12705, partial [Proteobacteria bacterium]|nr:hypothetical protein [Pseudomonadota bacterium]